MAAVPELDPRTQDDLKAEALARIPVHNPEWTNYNESDPGVTLVELFAFLTESLVYRANQIPERSRRKFLSLLGVPLSPASSAQGLVQIANEKGALQTTTLDAGLEVRAGPVPFRTEAGLDVLPVEARVYVKQPLDDPPQQVVDYYKQLYASYQGNKPPLNDLRLYEAVPLDTAAPVALADTVDGSVWIALLLRASDAADPSLLDARRRDARQALAGKTLSLGIVPSIDEPTATLTPTGLVRPGSDSTLAYSLPVGGALPSDPSQRLPQYRPLDAVSTANPLLDPAVVQLSLPQDENAFALWTNLDPLESGVGDFPPTLEDSKLADRLLTWVRAQVPAGSAAKLCWAGINATAVSQRAHVAGEVLPPANGEPDQTVTLSRTPVIPDSVRLLVTTVTGAEEWTLTDDLLAAGPEVPAPNPADPPGSPSPPAAPSKVFVLDQDAGVITFGDGARGSRPPAGAILRVSYDYGAGDAGNVAAGAIAQAPALPAGMKVSNPVRTWGGAEAESVPEGEKQAARYLQHRDRLVSVADFESIVWRTPGVELGRVDVLPAFNPELQPTEPGDAPGAVTVMVVPRSDPAHPDSPEPDAAFLDAICSYLDPRRLVTTDLYLRGPNYRGITISVGIDIVAGESEAVVREAVRTELLRFLAPVDPTLPPWFEDVPVSIDSPYVHEERGWPLGKSVVGLELQAVASRVPGVRFVRPVQIAEGASAADPIEFRGLDLPRVIGLSVAIGEPATIAAPTQPTQTVVPVPVVPENC